MPIRDTESEGPKQLKADTRQWNSGRVKFAVIGWENRPDDNYIVFEKNFFGQSKNPDQKFIYVYDPAKKWTFLVELIGVNKDETPKRVYPFVLRKEGIAPAQYGIKGVNPDKIMEIEEKYDLGAEEMATRPDLLHGLRSVHERLRRLLRRGLCPRRLQHGLDELQREPGLRL